MNNNKVYVDIGCSFPDSSPSPSIEEIKNSKITFLAELDPEKFNINKQTYNNCDNVKLCNTRIQPDNIIELLETNIGSAVNEIYLLKINIDGYDYFVLDSFLKKYRPHVINAEINEKIPPPIKFSVLYNEKYSWDVSHFYGMSMSMAYELCKNHNYSLVDFEFNNGANVILVDNKKITSEYTSYTPEILYKEKYIGNDYHNSIIYNQDVLHWQNLEPNDLIKEIKSFYKKYENYFTCEL
jgi:hypothetical protein